MIACGARAGDMARARAEIAVLDTFAPDFIASVFRGENPVFTRREDMEHLGWPAARGTFGITDRRFRILAADSLLDLKQTSGTIRLGCVARVLGELARYAPVMPHSLHQQSGQPEWP